MSAFSLHLRAQMIPLKPSQYRLLSSGQVLSLLTKGQIPHNCCHHLRSQPKRFLAHNAASDNGTSATIDSASPLQSDISQAVVTETGRILDTTLSDEMQNSFLSYAMSVIVGRALPDVRDGLKPVHRRILFAMHELGLHPSKPFRKSARVVGEVLGKYHPHGDTAVYDALVRLAQPFTMRLPLVDGHGNFGSQDDDPAAAMRYTECRLHRASTAAFLQDLEYNTVDYIDTFDAAQQEPTVLPARVPHLLINGSQGIAVGMATHIPPHNMGEIVAGLEALIKNPNITTAELLRIIPGPDFPTGGEILVSADTIEQAYSSGRGSISVRGKAFIEDEDSAQSSKKAGKRQKVATPGKSIIVLSELPYQTNKAKLVEHIADQVNKGILQGIADVRDESDRDGMRVVVEVKKGFSPEVVLNGLYRHTKLQTTFACNLVALVKGRPETLSLRDFLTCFLEFRCDIVTRRAKHMLGGAERRLHIVEGLAIAHKEMDRVVDTIRTASDSATAASKLNSDFSLTSEQADAVLSMTLRRLTALEIGKVEEEGRDLRERIARLKGLLGSDQAIRETVAHEAREVADSMGNPRRSVIVRDGNGQLTAEDLIPNRLSLIVYSSRGYIKRMTPDHFSVQGRGGKGMRGTGLREDDSIEEVQQVSDHQLLMFFTSDGKIYCLKAYQIPEASRTAVGTSFSSLLRIDKDQRVAAMISVNQADEDSSLLLLTKNGWMKQVQMRHLITTFKRPGMSAMNLEAGDELTWVQRCQPGEDVMIGHRDGSMARYSVDLFRPMSRSARGLQASKVGEGNSILGLSTLQQSSMSSDDSTGEESEEEVLPGTVEGPYVLFVTDEGYGKLTPVSSFRSYVLRRAKGIQGIKLANGAQLAAFHMVGSINGTDVLISTTKGLVTRISLQNVPVLGRSTRGVILMRMKDDEDRVSGVTLLDPSSEDSD